MKNIAKVTALALGIALASGYAAAEEKIAFINAGYIFQNHPDRQAVADKLDAEFKPVAEKLAASKKAVDDKIVAVLVGDQSYGHIKDISELPKAEVDRLMHYFLTYKNLPGEPVACRIDEVYDAKHAKEVIKASQEDYQEKYKG